MNSLIFLFDPYGVKARLTPVLLSAFPLLVSLFLLVPEYESLSIELGWVISFGGTTFFIQQLIRDKGKSRESKLYNSWCGKPSVAMLRHSNTQIDALTKNRYREFLQRAVPNLKLASVGQEKNNPKAADDEYESATSWLLEQTRDRMKFYLLFMESVNYGFRRNMWGLKQSALVLDLIALIIWFSVIYFEVHVENFWITLFSLDLFMWVCFTLIVSHTLFFIFKIRSKWVRSAADNYARRLLAACDTLDFENSLG